MQATFIVRKWNRKKALCSATTTGLLVAGFLLLSACADALSWKPSTTSTNNQLESSQAGKTVESAQGKAGSGSSGTEPSANNSASVKRVQKNEGGQVTIQVTWEENEASMDSLRFSVVMDTHSIDLDRYEMANLATLRTDTGREVVPLTWDGPTGGGHHRTGALVFPATDGETPLIEPGTRYVELVIRDVANVKERVLRWSLKGGL